MNGMFHNVSDVVAYVEALPPQQKDATARLTYIRSVLNTLGDPQDTIPAIHIAGTSGKGSTAYYAAELLRLSGVRVGLVVSPHVVSVMERAQIYSEQLGEAMFAAKAGQFIDLLEDHKITLSYIEFFVVFAYWLFADMKLDVMVIEVGMGGRLDATNVLNRPDKIVAITDIGYDHTEILGNSLPEIATEKAGIITPASQVVMNAQDAEVEQVIRAAAVRQKAQLQVLEGVYDDFRTRNLGLAVAAVSLSLHTHLDPSMIARAANLQIPGRFEPLDYHGHHVILDVAHNPQKIAALVQAVRKQYVDTRIVTVVAFGSGKKYHVPEIMRLLRSLGSEICLTTFPYVPGLNHQSLPVHDLKPAAEDATFGSIVSYEDPQTFLTMLKDTPLDPDAIYIVTGSFYIVDAIRSTLMESVSSSSDPSYTNG